MSKVKMAKVLLRYVEPIIARYETALNENFIGMAVAAWNVASLDVKQRLIAQTQLLDTLKSKLTDQEQSEIVKKLISDLIEYKIQKFSHIKNYIVSYQVLPSKKPGDFKLSVNSVPLPQYQFES